MGFSLCLPLPRSLKGFLSPFIFSFTFPSDTCKRRKGWSWASRPCICIRFLIKQLAMFWLRNSVCTVACACLCLVHVQGCFHKGSISNTMLKKDNVRKDFDISTRENSFWFTGEPERNIKGFRLWITSLSWSLMSICLPKTTGYKMSQCLVKIVKGTSWSTLKVTSRLESRWSRCHLRGALIYSLYHTNKGIWLYNCIFCSFLSVFSPNWSHTMQNLWRQVIRHPLWSHHMWRL